MLKTPMALLQNPYKLKHSYNVLPYDTSNIPNLTLLQIP